MTERVELFTSSIGKSLLAGSMVKIRVGSEFAVMTAGEWAALIANPKRADILTSERTENE